ncbi:hypothetical protein RND71_039711 [Anisodus tanguticus]|uniref:1-phosphatidylinositol 4-kinase n=1 Tax=Anisodus tanguticus TaxID=243964 RepID=A0AAE1QWZ7_9SOLA|nr:hypothetical protein RND71_039711 [Anisodus tanguticus]
MSVSNVDLLGASSGYNDGGGDGAEKRAISSFEEEPVDRLEKQEMALKLIGNVLDKVSIDANLLDSVRGIVKQQFQSMITFLKIRKRDWSEQGQSLKVRINAKLAAYQAAARLQIKTLASLDLDGKSSKKLLQGALASLIEAAETCLFSVWRKLRSCEELFSSLLSGISHAAVARDGQMLRVLLIRFKPLVLMTCAQADTWGSNQGPMFESVLKTSCEIIQFGWNKDRSPVDTFIMGFPIGERNNYAEEVERETNAAPSLQLNIIRLLADLNSSVKRPEVVDMILPKFIESLEEADASMPGLLRLRLLDAVARMASLGFEKSYREAVVLMTRCYLSKLAAVGSAESKTTAPEATTERVETLPAGFLLIARHLTTPKLRTDYRQRLLSLCSDVGLAAESKSGKSGADFLGPLLPAVAEICSDFDPTVDVEPSLLKLFRNLWFYVALFGLAPPLQSHHATTKSVSTTLNSVGSMGVIALQAVSGPYMWSADWSSAVQRISQGTPPLGLRRAVYQVVSSVKWLEDELELNALHNPGSRRGSGNEKAAISQRTALCAALGGRMEVSAMSTISGVKSTYLLAVAFLEIIRFSSNGGILNVGPSSTASRSAFSCAFEYLKSPGLTQAVSQCLTAIVHRAFETAVAWWLVGSSYNADADTNLKGVIGNPGPSRQPKPSLILSRTAHIENFNLKALTYGSLKDVPPDFSLEHEANLVLIVNDLVVLNLPIIASTEVVDIDVEADEEAGPVVRLNSIIYAGATTGMSYDSSKLLQEDRMSETGPEAEHREFTLSTHASFLVKNLSQRDEHIRDISVNLLNQLRDRFPQILWNSSCLDSLLLSVHNDPPSSVVNDPACVATIRSLYQKTVHEWIIVSLSQAPCTSQGLLQEKLCKANTWQKSQPTAEVVSLLSEIKIGTGKNDCWTGTKTANIPAVMAAAAAAKLKLTEAFNLEVLSTGMISATAKCNHAGEIAGMRRLYESIGSLDLPALGPGDMVENMQPKTESFSEVLLTKFVRLLQKFVNVAEKGGEVDKSSFHETCSQATALLLSDLGSDSKSNVESFSQLLRLLCWCPAYILTSDAMETGVFIWTWLVSAAPQLCSLVLAELVDAWLWTVDTKRGLFASEVRCSGPAAKLRPHLVSGEPESPPEKDPVEQILAHRLWLGFFIDRFEVVRHDSVSQLLLLGRLLQGTTKLPWNFSSHPAATGTFFTLMLLGLKFCSCKSQGNLQNLRAGLQLLEDRIYRASLGRFAHQPEWYDMNKNFALSEAQSVSMFVHHLSNEQLDTPQLDFRGRALENGSSLNDVRDQYHPVWGQMESYAVGREKRKQLLLMLCQHEADRLGVWAQPTVKETTSCLKISSEKWIDFARSAFSVDPRIALCLAARFPTSNHLKAEVTQLVQLHILEIRHIPEALPYFVTPKAIDENSTLLQQLPHWAACSITQALEFPTPAYKGHPRVMAYVLRVLESYPPQRVTFFMPQLVQALRYDDEKLVEGYLLRATQRSDIFAHILIWNLQGETCEPESGKDSSAKHAAFLALLPLVRQRIIDGFNEKATDVFQREFNFFDKVTSISGALYPLPKEERRAGIRRELEKIEMQGDDLYLPTAPNKIVKGIQVDSGIPLQSAAKVPIMITFNVADRDSDQNDIKPQACIFKVGDDCRQDVLALQVISLLKDIFEAVGLNLYLYPYGVLPTGPERGIIEVNPCMTFAYGIMCFQSEVFICEITVNLSEKKETGN